MLTTLRAGLLNRQTLAVVLVGLLAVAVVLTGPVPPAEAARSKDGYTVTGTVGKSDGTPVFSGLFDVAKAVSGNYLVIDQDTQVIFELSPSGQHVKTIGLNSDGESQFQDLSGIATDLAGYLYVIDGNTIKKLSSAGDLVLTWGGKGNAEGKLSAPAAIETDQLGGIYVADKGNNRIQKFDANGQFITAWGTYGSSLGQFTSVEDLAINPAGNIVVMEPTSTRLQEFTPDGAFVSSTSVDSPSSQFGGIEIDSTGAMYLTDSPSIKKFTADGSLVTIFAGARGIYRPYLDASGVLFAPSRTRLYRFDTDTGARLESWYGPRYQLGAHYAASTGYRRANDITVNKKNEIFVFDARIQRYSASGKALSQWGPYYDQLNSIEDSSVLAVDSKNNVYVGDIESKVVRKYNSSGQYVSDIDANLTTLVDIAVDRSDNVYVLGYNSKEKRHISKFSASGKLVTSWAKQGSKPGQLLRAGSAITVADDGTVYVAHGFMVTSKKKKYHVQAFTSKGKFVRGIGVDGSKVGRINWSVVDVATDSRNSVYIAESGGRIQKFSSSGKFIRRVNQDLTSIAKGSTLAGIAVGKSDAVYGLTAGKTVSVQKFVYKRGSSVAVKVSNSKPKVKKTKVKLTVTVKTQATKKPTGKIQVNVNGKTVRTVKLKAAKKGKVTITLPAFKKVKKKQVVTVSYTGTGKIKASSKKVTVRVTK